MSIRKRAGRFYIDVKMTLPNGQKFRLADVVAPVQTQRGAEQYEQQIRRSVLDGTYGKSEAPKLEEWWTEYAEWIARNNRESTVTAKTKAWEQHILPEFGAVRLGNIGPAEMERLKAELQKKGLKPKTVNNVLGYFQHGLEIAARHGKGPHPSPVLKVEEEKREAAWLDLPEFSAVMKAAQFWLERVALIHFLLDTGCRIGEALALHWRDVDLKRRIAVIRYTVIASTGNLGPPKESDKRDVPLTRALVETLTAHRHLQSERVFCQRDGTPLTHARVRNWLPEACARAKVPRITSHGCRHTATAHMVMDGVPEAAIMAALGWKTTSVLRRYSHLSTQARLDAADRLEAFRAGPPEPEAETKTEEGEG